jgi:hypothetical protein
MLSRIHITLLLACILAGMAANSRAEDHLLFDSAENLDIILEFPVRTLLKRAKKKPVLQGQLRYVDTNGNEVAIDIDITTRGRSRLEHCSFPPLSVFLNPDQVASTIFAGQEKLKIVTHCNNRSTYLRYLHQEFGIYRTYNLLSEHSFRVRMLNVTYRDIEQKRGDAVKLAFFIESDNEVAKRLGMIKVNTVRRGANQYFRIVSIHDCEHRLGHQEGAGHGKLLSQCESHCKTGCTGQLDRAALRFRSGRHHRNEICVALLIPWNKNGASSTLPGSLPTQ